MKKYYYSDGQNQFGPYDIEELKEKQIKKETLVWYEGLGNWSKAGDIQDLAVLFKSVPPPLTSSPPPLSSPPPPPVQSTIQPAVVQPKKKSNTGLILGIVGAVAIVFLIVIFNQNNSANYDGGASNTYVEPPHEKTPEELRQELHEKEKVSPLTYLKIEDAKMEVNKVKTRDEGLFNNAEYSDDGWNISANIKSTATMAKFKDVVVKVSYFSETGTLLSSEDFIQYEFYEPNSVTPIFLKVYPPESFNKFNVEIKSATGIQ